MTVGVIGYGRIGRITARKLATHAVQQTLERLNEAQRAARIGDWDFDIATGAISWSQFWSSALYRAALRARPRATDQTPPVSRRSSSIACDISRATRPFPSRNGCIHNKRW